MKHTIFIFLMIFSVNIYAQAEDENFYLNDSKMTWQKAYVTNKSQQEIFAYFEKSKIFKKIIIENNQLIGELEPHATDPKKTGVAAVPVVVNKNDFSGKVIIQYRPKEKDYLVSMTEMVLIGRGDYLPKNEEQPFEEHYLKKGESEYRPFFVKLVKEVYNTTFTEIFDMKK